MTSTIDRLLPEAFADLEPFAPRWCLATEVERVAQRNASSMEELEEFYDAAFERAAPAMTYFDGFPFPELPDEARRLLQLILSLVVVSFAVEAWHRPSPPGIGDASLERFVEPQP